MGDRVCRRTALSALLGAASLPALARAAQEVGDGAARERFASVAQRAERLDQLHALVVVHEGREVFARAFRGPPVDRPVNVKSVSKSLVALLTGMAIDRGLLPGAEATLAEVAPDLLPDGADSRAGTISVADLLTMRAGLKRTSGANYGAFVSSGDWVRHTLTRPFVAEPGARFQYSTGSYHVLGAVLAAVGRKSLLALAREWLGEPLAIAIPPWTRDPQGRYLGGNNMALSPRAMAVIGEMVRQQGVHAKAQVVPARWIAASLTPRTRSPFSGDEYGYGWFLREMGGLRAAYARGYGGQMIYVVPHAGLTVAVTSDPTRPARTDGHAGDLHALVEGEVMPAVAR